MKRLIITLTFLLLAHQAFATGGDLNTYFEFGRKGSSGLVEEEDLTDEFNYSKYDIKIAQDLSKQTSYSLRYQYYIKDFDTLQNLDNTFNLVSLGFDQVVYSKDKFSIKIAPDFDFKEKLYKNANTSNYDQIKADLPITFKQENDWWVKLTGGINSYHYPKAPKDQLKLNAKLEVSKDFFDDKLNILAFYKFQYIDRQKLEDRKETTYGASADMKLDQPFIKSIEAGVEKGMDNTIIYEEREDSYDYKFLNWFLKTKHVFGEKIKTSVKYGNMSRVYADFKDNFNGFAVENPWDVKVFETKDSTLNVRLTYLHKQFRYPYVSNPFAFHNDSVFSEMEFIKKDNWRVIGGADVRFYNYPAKRTNDKIYYIEKIAIEKYFLKKDLVLGFEYKNTYKNFLHKLAIIEDVFRFRATYKF